MKTAEIAEAKGSEAIFIKCDVTDGRQVQEMAEKAEKRFGRVDILVNSAGGVIGEGGAIETWMRITGIKT
jgi:NAD(P)-dependent dehydrogenase (short-subunit alcohol dehydrogenase family)